MPDTGSTPSRLVWFQMMSLAGEILETETPNVRALQAGGLLQCHLQDEYEQHLPSVSEDGCGRVCGQQRQWAEPTGGGPSPTDPLRSGVEPEVCSGCSCRYLQRLQLLHLAGSLISLQPVNLVFKGAAAPTGPPSCEGCPAI